MVQKDKTSDSVINNLDSEQQQITPIFSHFQRITSVHLLSRGLNHQFNNILLPLKGLSEMLKEELPPQSSLHHYLEDILNEASTSQRLIKEIIAFSSTSEDELTALTLQTVIQERYEVLKTVLPKSISIKIELPKDPIEVLANRLQLDQILMNSIENACDAVPKSEGQLRIGLIKIQIEKNAKFPSGLSPGNYALLSVTDNGTGIPKDQIPRIFDPFFTTKNKASGTGLSVAKKIVEAFNGKILLDSEPGQGTDVRIYLPVYEQTKVTKQPDSFVQNKGGTEKILLIDPDESTVRIQRWTLEKQGYQVTPIMDETFALELFKNTPDEFDLLIVSPMTQMAKDFDIINEIRKLNRDIPIIVCINPDKKLSEQDIFNLSVQGHILKPIKEKEMARVIRNVLDNY